ncbi:Non-catalytic module family DOC2, partial [Piromyces sp. E2]
YGVTSSDSFYKRDRAEIFKLTDNEVAVFKITLPEDEFALLKERAKNSGSGSSNLVIDFAIKLNEILNVIQQIEFNKVYPDSDYVNLLPELKIGDDGLPKINVNRLLGGYNFNIYSYLDDLQNDPSSVQYKIYSSHPEFDIYKIVDILKGMKMSDDVDSEYKKLLNDTYEKITSSKRNEKRDTVPNGDENILEDEDSEFKTKNATLSVDIRENKKFKKVTFKLGGHSSRVYSKLGFNIKIRGNEKLYGRSQFKIRPDASEPTFLRSKLVSDIHNRLGLQCISSNYITLYINDEYMGLYILNDAYKPSWIEEEYGEKDTKTLYRCDSLVDFNPMFSFGCVNEDEEVTDDTQWIEFLTAVNAAKTPSDLEDIFDVDQFLTELAIDYLLGSVDHFTNPLIGHNFSLYKQSNGKWIYLSYDFDLDVGQGGQKINASFDEFIRNSQLIDILILNDPSRFEKILKKVVTEVFNPATLFPHIDEMKKLIKPYVEKDKTPDANGNYPGRINTSANDFYTLEEWDSNSEFTKINTAYGIKDWILRKYRFVCNYYEIDCDPTYMDENSNSGNVTTIIIPTPTTTVDITTSVDIETTTVAENTTSIDVEIETPTTSSSAEEEKRRCWSELIGYKCCPPDVTTVYDKDEYGEWGYDFKTKEWCGLTMLEESPTTEDCWSEKLGYPCCMGCKVYEVDNDGSWGYELNHWCGIQSHCEK